MAITDAKIFTRCFVNRKLDQNPACHCGSGFQNPVDQVFVSKVDSIEDPAGVIHLSKFTPNIYYYLDIAKTHNLSNTGISHLHKAKCLQYQLSVQLFHSTLQGITLLEQCMQQLFKDCDLCLPIPLC